MVWLNKTYRGDIMKKWIILLGLLVSIPAQGATPRHASNRYKFAKTVPCPATGKIQQSCPGYVVDHIIPLCAGGADSPENMQWQKYQESLQKDIVERAMCRKLKERPFVL